MRKSLILKGWLRTSCWIQGRDVSIWFVGLDETNNWVLVWSLYDIPTGHGSHISYIGGALEHILAHWGLIFILSNMCAKFGKFLSMFRGSNLGFKWCNNKERRKKKTHEIQEGLRPLGVLIKTWCVDFKIFERKTWTTFYF